MAGRSSFGPGAYVVRYAWWSPLVPAVAGAALVAGFVITRVRRPAARRWLPDAHPGMGDWANYAAVLLMPIAGLCLLVLAAVHLRRAIRGMVMFAAASKGVYWCPTGGRGRWFAWDDIAAIEFHGAEGGSTGRGAVALCGYAPPGEDGFLRLVDTRLGGWRIGRRRLARALREFAPDVEIIA